jgi:hypothetical protein
MKMLELHDELLDYFNEFTKWIKENRRISDAHLERLKQRAISELHNDSNKWYHEKDFSDLYVYCFFKTTKI